MAEHFNISVEPHLGETLELIAVNWQKIGTITAEQVGTTEPPTVGEAVEPFEQGL